MNLLFMNRTTLLGTWVLVQARRGARGQEEANAVQNHGAGRTDTHQVVAMWSPSPAQEDSRSAADFHRFPSPLCISSAGRRRQTEVAEARREVSVFYGSHTKSLETSSQTHTLTGEGQPQHVWKR